MRIAFLGLGQMGAAIARNILNAGHELTVWNRSPDKAATLVAAGAQQRGTPAEAAEGAEIVFTMLADDRAVEAVTFGENGLLTAKDGPVHVGLSTISLDLARKLTEAQGQHYASAPVFGRPNVAAAAKLNIVAAGPEAVLAKAQPIFAAIGQRVLPVGDAPLLANLVKLCGNFMIMASLEAMGEALALAEKNGLDKAKLFEVLTGTLFGSAVFTNYGPAMLERSFRPAGFPAPLGLKDMNLVNAAATDSRVPMPLLGTVREHLLQTIGQQGEDVDWSAIVGTIAANAGL
jgi:3-hydroxyisobutyrate dehydrogenase-like beta-hydroxyacid dehydrogenase